MKALKIFIILLFFQFLLLSCTQRQKKNINYIPLTEEDIKKIIYQNDDDSFAGIITRAPYGMSLIMSSDILEDNRVWIESPGIPYKAGRIEIKIKRHDSDEIKDFKVIEYRPVSKEAILFHDIDKELPEGEYLLEAKLYLYGDFEEMGKNEEPFITQKIFKIHRKKPDLIENMEEILIDGYSLNQVRISDETDSDKPKLEKIYKKINKIKLEKIKIKKIVIEGHTCDIGTPQANDKIAYKRAYYAKEKLKELGIQDETIFELKAMGNISPLIACDNNKCSEEERLKNRRVVIKIYYDLK